MRVEYRERVKHLFVVHRRRDEAPLVPALSNRFWEESGTSAYGKVDGDSRHCAVSPCPKVIEKWDLGK